MSELPSTSVPLPIAISRGGMGWRIGVSVLSVFGVASFLILYFAVWDESFAANLDFVVTVLAFLAFIAANAAAWASWGIVPTPRTRQGAQSPRV